MSKLSILDLADIKFPSDAITIADLRKLRPMSFDFGFAPEDADQPRFFFEADHGQQAGDVLGGMLFAERSVAVTAYAKAEGLPPREEDYISLREALIEAYQRYKIASGPQHAEQLVRDIEQQAATLSTNRQR